MAKQGIPTTRNLIKRCKKRGIKDPRRITEDELKTEFLVCKLNLDTLAKNSPQLRKKFLKNLVTAAKIRGDKKRAEGVLRIIQNKATSSHLMQGGEFVPLSM